MESNQFSFLCRSVIALSALSAAASGAQPGSENDLRHMHQARSAFHQALSANQPLPPRSPSASTTADVGAPSLTPLTNQLPNGIQFTMLLTDGTVMAQDGIYHNTWWKLTPDINGSYLNGTWTQLASLPVSYSPAGSAEAVLADGRVVVVGGEYSGPNFEFTLTNECAIYDPSNDTWTPLAPPPGFDYIGDSPSVVLPDGRFLLGQKLTTAMSALDPSTLQWTNLESKHKNDFNAEEGWTLLPDGRVLTLDVLDAPQAEQYSADKQKWKSIRNVPVDLHSPTTQVGCVPYGPNGSLCYYPPGEIGPAILRPDGTVFATGSFANGDPNLNPDSAAHTAVYDTHKGKWNRGPDFPLNDINGALYGDNAGDSYAVLLPNGKVLVEGFISGYEFDGTQLVITVPYTVYMGSLSVLPTGEVLFGGFSPAGLPSQLYSSPGDHDPSWEPVITQLADEKLRPGKTYQVWGQQFNGLSQAQAFGDEFSAAQNYPLVRITNNETHHVFYARTHDHSTMGVATGEKLVWTFFDVPQQIENGASQLEVVANGIGSQPVDVWVDSDEDSR